MAGKRAEPPPTQSQSDEGERKPSRERIGPVAVERMAKDDGRAMILYARVEKTA